MKTLLIKPIAVLVIALLLIGLIANSSPVHPPSLPENAVQAEQMMVSEWGTLEAAIAHSTQQARQQFQTAAAKYHTSLNSLESHKDSPTLTYRGIDVSHYQGDLLKDINQLQHLDFFIVKATDGITETDPMFQQNWQWLKQAKRLRGAYHFYQSQDDPIAQAEHFVTTVTAWQPDDIAPIVDIEAAGLSQKSSKTHNSQQLQQDLLQFLAHVQSATNKRPIIYTNTAFAQQWFTNTKLAQYPLWIADYTQAASPTVPRLWQSQGALIWQKSDSYHVNSTQTDFDIFHGQRQQLTGSK